MKSILRDTFGTIFGALWLVVKAFLFGVVVLVVFFGLQMYGVFPVQVPVSGASMLPTLPEEGRVPFQRYIFDERFQEVIPQQLSTSDIVVFENQKTLDALQKQKKEGSGFVKRIVGMPGDKVEVRNGFVYVNGVHIEEPYILKPRSTFGGDVIKECQEVSVPKDHVFVLGDNRKVSMDSRHLGFIPIKDVHYFIPFIKQQSAYATRWRDTSDDFNNETQSTFSVNEYIQLLNSKRREAGVVELEYQPKLEQSAKLRAETMLKYDDFEFDAPKSGYTMERAMADVSYSTIRYGEFPILGYYTAEELFLALEERNQAQDFLLNPDYDDIGISTFVGQLNDCPVQVVVHHMGGYVPPNYTQEDIQGFENALQRLEEVRPGWENLKTNGEFYNKNKESIDRIVEIINIRIVRYNQILNRMRSNEWMTEEEKNWLEEDRELNKSQNDLANMLNNTN